MERLVEEIAIIVSHHSVPFCRDSCIDRARNIVQAYVLKSDIGDRLQLLDIYGMLTPTEVVYGIEGPVERLRATNLIAATIGMYERGELCLA